MTRPLIAMMLTACMWGLLPASAAAAPIQLNAAAWTAAAAGLTVVTEDFSSFAEGDYADPFTIANGVFTTDIAVVRPVRIVDNTPTVFCGATPVCLMTAGIPDHRVFSGFAAGTTLWSVGTFHALNPGNVFRVTVVGGSGVSVFDQTGNTFWGFGDTLGLTSVTFQNLGTGGAFSNYSFDNVATAEPATTPVPEPATVLLVGTGAVALASRLRQRRRGRCAPSAGRGPE